MVKSGHDPPIAGLCKLLSRIVVVDLSQCPLSVHQASITRGATSLHAGFVLQAAMSYSYYSLAGHRRSGIYHR